MKFWSEVFCGVDERKNILLVEDEVFIALREKEQLEQEGCRIVLASNDENATVMSWEMRE
ncbi:MAG TPA: hypothetical protein VF857_00005 [Spirochaetota bacterium]